MRRNPAAFAILVGGGVAIRRLPILTRRAALAGVLDGFVIYAAMNLVVLPLSAFPRKVTFPPLVLATGLFVHMFGIGLPIALATRKAPGREAA